MPPMRATPAVRALPCLLVAATFVSGCGGGSGGSTSTAASAAEPAPSRPAPARAGFPSAQGRTLRQVLKAADSGPSEDRVAPEAMVFYRGENRYPFEVFERDGSPVSDAEVAIYYARVPTPHAGAKSRAGNKGQIAKAEQQALDQPAFGPFPAAVETLATKPAYRSESTAADPEAATVVYSTKLDFPSDGEWRLAAILREGDETRAKLLPIADVGEFHRVPRPGQAAPRLQTPAYADALGKEPIVLLFTTPEFCQSRVCGPVVDVVNQVKHETGDKAAFIQMEIYNDNDPGKGVRPQVRAFRLPSEPWLFTINRHGVISSAIEGALGLELMNSVVDKVGSE
jgi:hypothetical protein